MRGRAQRDSAAAMIVMVIIGMLVMMSASKALFLVSDMKNSLA